MRTNLVEYENFISSDNEAHHQNCEAMEIPNPKKESGNEQFFQVKNAKCRASIILKWTVGTEVPHHNDRVWSSQSSQRQEESRHSALTAIAIAWISDQQLVIYTGGVWRTPAPQG